MEKKSPEEIVKILHSISKFSIKDGELEIHFVDSKLGEYITSFKPESFTRQFLEFIEDYLFDV